MLSLRLVLLFVLAAVQTGFSQTAPITVSRVPDGDTFVTSSGETIRLQGIDAPENDEASRDYLQRLILEKKITLSYEGGIATKDKYGRTLAFALVNDSLDVGNAMVSAGYALAYLTYPCSKTNTYLEAEYNARRAGIGMWAGHFISTLAPPVTAEPSKTIAPKTVTPKQEEVTVYITKTGHKYHRAGCRYLSKSMIPISKKDAIARGYSPCSVCRP